MVSTKERGSNPIVRCTSALSILVILLTNLGSAQASKNEPTLQKDGDFMIKALLPITRKNGELLDTYAIASELVKLTIDEVNNNSTLLPNVQLGYEIINDKLDLNFIMEQAIGIVSKYRPSSICREDEEFCSADQPSRNFINKRIGAVIGPATSSSSVPSASLLGLYNVPQISFSASSKTLSDKSRFKSFLRTIPSDTYQAEAIASFVQNFDWNYVFFIGSDDEYGRQGLTSFKTAARKLKVCTADDVNIPFQRPDDANKAITDIIKKMKSLPSVRVAILFMFERQAEQVLQEAEKEGIRNVTWILSDAIGPNIMNYNINKELLNGSFGVDFVYKKIPKIEQYLLNMTVEKTAGNPWMLKLLEKNLNCSSKAIPGKRECKKNETLNSDKLNLSNRWSRFTSIINSINAVAYGLDNLLKCNGRLANGRCPNTTFPLSSKDLYHYIQNATFPSPSGEKVSFDDSGDLETKKYMFRNVLANSETGMLEFKPVAIWSSTQQKRLSFLKNGKDKNHGLIWKNNEIPSATCSQVCQPGQKQVGQSDCCWACHPCPRGQISNKTGATVCYQCASGWYANEKQTKCLKISIDYINSDDAFSIVIISISCLGLVTMVIVAALFFYAKATPLIQDSNPILLGLLLLATSLGFLYSIFQVSLYRTDSACRFLGAFLLFVVLLVGSTLLAKTKTCDSYLKKFASTYINPATEYATLILIGVLLLFQLFFMGVWFLTDTPTVHYMESSQALHIRECNSSWAAARFIATGFPLAVLFLATAFAFKERNDRKNHHEAKYISFCTISFCILLIAFFPTYRFAQGITTSIVIATTSLVGALAICGCIILPKVYILVVQPERNVPEEERERSHNTVSSAHTAGSQHQPVFTEPREESPPTNNENGVVKDVSVF